MSDKGGNILSFVQDKVCPPKEVHMTEMQIKQLNVLVRARVQAMLMAMPPDIQNDPVGMCMGIYFQASFECITANFATAQADPSTIAIHELIALQWELLMRNSDAEQQSDGSGHGDDGTSEVGSESKDN